MTHLQNQTCARCAAVDEACLKECPDNSATTMGTPDPDLGRYLLVNEDGVELIDTDDPAEVVRRLGALWGSVSEQAEQMQHKIRELETPRGEVVAWAWEYMGDFHAVQNYYELSDTVLTECSPFPVYRHPHAAAVALDGWYLVDKKGNVYKQLNEASALAAVKELDRKEPAHGLEVTQLYRYAAPTGREVTEKMYGREAYDLQYECVVTLRSELLQPNDGHALRYVVQYPSGVMSTRDADKLRVFAFTPSPAVKGVGDA